MKLTAEPLMTAEELSARYGVPVKTLANWRSNRQGPAYIKAGKHIRYRVKDVLEWEATRIRPTSIATKNA